MSPLLPPEVLCGAFSWESLLACDASVLVLRLLLLPLEAGIDRADSQTELYTILACEMTEMEWTLIMHKHLLVIGICIGETIDLPLGRIGSRTLLPT